MESNEIVINKLDIIQHQLAKISEHIEDTALTVDDLKALEEAEQDLKEGKTRRL